MARRGGEGVVGADGQQFAIVNGGYATEPVCLDGERGAGDVEEGDLVGGRLVAAGVHGIGFKQVGALQGRQSGRPIGPSGVAGGGQRPSRCR